jgi:hypothetical protein
LAAAEKAGENEKAQQLRDSLERRERALRRLPNIPSPSVGDYTLTAEQINSIARLVKTINDPRSEANKTLQSKGMKVNIQDILGHTHVGQTACPGEGCLGIPEAFDEAWDRQGPLGER